MNLCTTYLDVKVPELTGGWIGSDMVGALAMRDFVDRFSGLRIYLRQIPEGLLAYQTPKHHSTARGFTTLHLSGLNELGAFLLPFIHQPDGSPGGNGDFVPISQEAFFLPAANILGCQAMDAEDMDVLFGPKPDWPGHEDETPLSLND